MKQECQCLLEVKLDTGIGMHDHDNGTDLANGI